MLQFLRGKRQEVVVCGAFQGEVLGGVATDLGTSVSLYGEMITKDRLDDYDQIARETFQAFLDDPASVRTSEDRLFACHGWMQAEAKRECDFVN